MKLQNYLDEERKKMIEDFEEQYGFDGAGTIRSLLDELQEYGLDESFDIYDILDTHSCYEFDWEESVDDWFSNDILDGRLELFTDYMEYNLYEYGFDGVVNLFDTTRKTIRYETLRDHDSSILDYMCAIHLMDLGYTDVEDKFFEEMCSRSLDKLCFDSDSINVQEIFAYTLEEYGWTESTCGRKEDDENE